MKQQGVMRIISMIAVLALGSLSVSGAILDLTTAGSSGSIGAATFQQTDQQPTGTGVIDSFLRIRATGQEAAYNTSVDLPQSGPFNQLDGSIYNRDLSLSSLPVVSLNGVNNYQFLLDINQTSTDPKLSLNQLEIFLTSTPGQSGGSWDYQTANHTGTGRLIQVPGGGLAPLTDLNPVYDLNPDGGTANGVILNYGLNHGSGSGDMYLYLPTSLFQGVSGNYVFFYSEFGHPPGQYPSNDGFEEWAVVTTGVPEPATIAVFALLLLPLRTVIQRRLRRA